MPAPLKGLHSPVYIEPSLLDGCHTELRKLLVRYTLGCEVNPLERLALATLQANGLIPSLTHDLLTADDLLPTNDEKDNT